MTILLILAIFIGLYQSQEAIRNVRLGISEGVPESKNLVEFIFLNK